MKMTEIKVVGYENNVTPTGLNETKITAEVAENITAEVNITTGWTNSYSVMILVDGEKAAYIYSDEERSIYEVKKVKESKKTSFSRNKGLHTATYVSEKMREYKSVSKAYNAALAENGLTYEGIIEISNAMIEKMIEIREENAEDEVAMTDVEDDGTNEDTDDETVIKETDEDQAAHLATAEEEIARIDSLIYHIKNHIDFVKREYDFTLKNIKTSTAWYVRCDESSIMKHMDLITSGWYKRMNIGKKRLAARIKKEHNAYIGAVQDLNDAEVYLWKLQAELTESQNEIEELEVKKAELENTLKIETPAEETVIDEVEEIFDLDSAIEDELYKAVNDINGKVRDAMEIDTYCKEYEPEPPVIEYYAHAYTSKTEGGVEKFSGKDFKTAKAAYDWLAAKRRRYSEKTIWRQYIDKYEDDIFDSNIYHYETGEEEETETAEVQALIDEENSNADARNFLKECTRYAKVKREEVDAANAEKIVAEVKGLWDKVQAAEQLDIAPVEVKVPEPVFALQAFGNDEGTAIAELDAEITELQNKLNTALDKCRKLAEDKLKTVIDGANDEVLIQVKFSGENFNRKLRRNDKVEVEILGNGEIFALDATRFYASYDSFKAFMAAVNGLVDAIKRGDKEYIFPENK